MTRFCQGVREGDEWAFDTNTGAISRIITGFDDERTYYRSFGEPYEKSCAHATFNRWLKGAHLVFRKEPPTPGVSETPAEAVHGTEWRVTPVFTHGRKP